MYRKFSADNIFSGYKILPQGHVLITDANGVVLDCIEKAAAGDDIQHFNGLLSPGFINCHCHIELSHMKGIIPKHTGLVDFVQQVMSQRNASPEAKQQAMMDAEMEMYNNGIVAVGDICNTTDSIALKQNSKIAWHNFIEVSGFVDAVAQKRFDGAKEIAAIFISQLPNCKATISPHAPYSVSKTLFELLNNETANELITIHNQESAEEDKLYQNKTGDFLDLYKNFGIDITDFTPTQKSSLQSWLPYFTNNQSMLLVHDTFTSKEDINFQFSTLDSQFSSCLCPNANLYIENKLPPVEMFLQKNINIVTGTDSLASNDQLNILEELKTVQQNLPSIDLATLLQWATGNGASALQMSDKLGSFEKGKQPGVVLIENMDGLNFKGLSSSKRIL